MAFAAVTILMDTLHQHFLQPNPRFSLRNKKKVRLLYKHLSSLQTSLEQDFKVGECDETIKALEAQMRDFSIELRFQIEHHLTLFYLGKSMKLRLHSAQKLLPILNGATKGGVETMDLEYVLKMLGKHFMLPVSGMPAHINNRAIVLLTRYADLIRSKVEEESENDEAESEDELKSEDKQEESDDESETEEEQNSDDEQGSHDEQEESDVDWETVEEQNRDDEQGSHDEPEESDDEWETDEEEQNSDDEQEESDDEWESILCEAESIIRQELRAPSYLNKYMKQRIQARHKIHQIFMQGIKFTSYIKKDVLKVKNGLYNQSNTPQGNNTCASLRVRGPEGENVTVGDSLQHTTIEMVGCDDEFNMIMDKLNQQSKQREIVSIVGMGGIGKTTLARRIYGDASFISHFDCRAWVTISQAYNPTKVFKSLLRSLSLGVHEENYEASNNELAERVYKCLKRQRYLIIIDDIWSTDDWCDLQKCFPDDNNQSRMLLTTRLKNVADYAGSGGNLCHTMRFLNSDESWNLFQNKVLPKGITLSLEFERIGRETVKRCKGLPLAINVVAGLLSNPKQDLNEWELIVENVHTLSIDHSNNQGENIIELSYTFLPHHLKHCFLSIGCFPEDKELAEHFIVDFWVSEGFLKVLKSKSLEDVARESLQDLVDRNLLLVSTKMDKDGLLKVYQMHDVLRELALREAQKEKLFCVNYDDICGVGFRRTQLINSSRISHPWSIRSKICSYNSLSHTCSTFLSLDFSNYNSLHFHFKFLRGLIVEMNDDDDYVFTDIMGLVHLRYLRCYSTLKLNSLPLFMLWNLQKLDLDVDDDIDEPLNIRELPQLKNLIAWRGITLVPPKSVHHNLESIRFLDYRSCTEELFMRIPNLRTLEVDRYSHQINQICKAFNWFVSLACLYKLEDLQVSYTLLHPEFSTIHSMETLSIENLLPNLKKLKLFCTELKWKNMDVFGMLPKLEVLILDVDAAVGKKWEPKDGGFRGLKFLSIDCCDLQIWKVTSGHFPVLECLVLMNMHDFKRIPSDFADIATLRSIKLYDCSKSTISSAKCIQEEQQEYGNNAFTVDILREDDFHDSNWY